VIIDKIKLLIKQLETPESRKHKSYKLVILPIFGFSDKLKEKIAASLHIVEEKSTRTHTLVRFSDLLHNQKLA